MDLSVMRMKQSPIMLFCDNNGFVTKEPKNIRERNTLSTSVISLERLSLMEMQLQRSH